MNINYCRWCSTYLVPKGDPWVGYSTSFLHFSFIILQHVQNSVGFWMLIVGEILLNDVGTYNNFGIVTWYKYKK